MSSYYLSGIFGTILTTSLVNPENKRPSVIVSNGQQEEKFYAIDSDQVQRVPEMLRSMSYFVLILYSIAFLMLEHQNTSSEDIDSGFDHFDK